MEIDDARLRQVPRKCKNDPGVNAYSDYKWDFKACVSPSLYIILHYQNSIWRFPGDTLMAEDKTGEYVFYYRDDRQMICYKKVIRLSLQEKVSAPSDPLNAYPFHLDKVPVKISQNWPG
jgi:hypothetical protein